MRQLRPVLLLALALAALDVGPIGAQETPPPKPLVLPADGPELFKWVLNQRGLRPSRDLEEVRRSPKKAVMILMGNSIPYPELSQMRAFLLDGGTVLYASDMNCEELIPICGVFITGKLVRSPKDDCYRKLDDFPLVHAEGLDRRTAGLFRHRSGNAPLDLLVSNRPSSVRLMPVETRVPVGFQIDPRSARSLQMALRPLAGFDRRSYWGGVINLPDDPKLQALGNFDPARDFAIMAADLSQGARLMILADHSMVLNQLLVRSPPFNRAPHVQNLDNLEFAENLVDWLAGEGDAKRSVCHFVYDAQHQADFELPGGEMPLPPLDQLANFALSTSNRVADSLQSKDAFNRILLDKVGWRALLRNWLIAGAGFLLVRTLWRLWNSRTAAARGKYCPPDTEAADLDDPNRRAALQAARDDYSPAARALVQSSFRRFTGAEHPTRSLLLASVPWYALSDRRAIGWIWPIGFGSKRRPVSGRTFRQIIGFLRGLEGRFAARQAPALPSQTGPVPKNR